METAMNRRMLASTGLLVWYVAVSAWMAQAPADPQFWLIASVLPALFVVVLIATYRHLPLSPVSYGLITAFLTLHTIGVHYTYAEVPVGLWIDQVLHLGRNHFDRIVHFSFGFLLAYPMREMFLKWAKFPAWVAWSLPIEITMSVSALYELIEWAVADIFFPSQGDAYLGTQGDIWDAQKDIFVAFMGSIIATTIVSIVKKVFKVYEQSEENSQMRPQRT